jgi:tRNA A37 N6-isopentenylltransferase MiaA
LIKVRTRQFAKRQKTWFRHQAAIRWFQILANEKAEETAGRIEQAHAEWRNTSVPNDPAPS